jgi:hypothetical protein
MITILYRPNSEHERQVIEFQRRLEQNRVEAKLIDVDSRDGIATASLYDVMRYPAVLALEIDGRPIQTWSGELPLIEEVSYYAHV